jgi:hypothetical protein
MNWEAISKAYDLVHAGTASRVDGPNWKVYRVAELIRIDISKEGKD